MRVALEEGLVHDDDANRYDYRTTCEIPYKLFHMEQSGRTASRRTDKPTTCLRCLGVR